MRVDDVDLRSLYTVETIQRLGSITAAADELGLSQPAVSHALRKLRDAFKDPLFVRTPSGVTPTPRGTQLAASARRIQSLVRAELSTSTDFDPAELHTVVHLCMTDVGEMVMLPGLVDQIRRQAPGVEVQTLTLPPDRVTESLDSGVVNLAIGPFPELARSQLRRERLYQRGFMCLAARDQPVLRDNELTMDAYLAVSHMLIRSLGRSEDVFERFLAENGITRRVALTVPNMLCVPAVARQTDLIATVPQSVGRQFSNYPGIRVFPVPFRDPITPPTTTVSQYWSARFENDPVNTWLRELVAQLYLEA